MKEIRDIKIDLVMGNKNPIIERFMEITKDLCIIKCDVYNEDGLEFIYHNKDGEWIFYQDAKNGEFWANYKRYWEILEREFRLEYEEIQAITKYLVEEALKREVGTPVRGSFFTHNVVEDVLKREVDTPRYASILKPSMVEEALNRELVTPQLTMWITGIQVEEALKREVSTPYTNDILLNLVPVEDALKKCYERD